MNAKEIIAFIQNAEKKTPVKVYLKEKKPVAFPDCKVFGKTTAAIPLCRCWIKNISMHGSSQGQSFEIRWKSVTMPLS